MLLHADFARAGADLLITAADGTQYVIVEYFNAMMEAGLMTESGSLLPFDLVSALAGPASPGQYAQSEEGIEEAPIGRVDETVGEFPVAMVQEFLRSVTNHARINLHVDLLRSGNDHHGIEAIYKSVGRALSEAVRRSDRVTGIPSTKGSL